MVKTTNEMAAAVPQAAEEAASRSALERELVQRSLAGDGRAFGSLVRPHLGMLYRVAGRAAHNEALAEDAVQETLEIAYRRLGRYRPGTSLRAFLATIAMQRGFTLMRSESRLRQRQELSGAPPAAADAERQMALAQERQRVYDVLQAMPRKRREVALLRLEAGLSYREIAAATGSTEGSARVLVHQALKELRARLGGNDDE